MDHAAKDQVALLAAGAKDWLLNEAAPLWSAGRKKDFYVERLTMEGRPDQSPRRLFVQARMVYSFCRIGALGWRGPWRKEAEATLNALLAQGKREDGFFVHSFNAEGGVFDHRADLYDQAFMLFCFAHAGEFLNRPDLFSEAERLMDRLEADWNRPSGGFFEGEIVDPAYRLQNPHMHLAEAFLALAAATGKARWSILAEEMADLCRRRFIDRKSGALTEYFTQDLEPAAGVKGRIVEPGHCCEWAWLFENPLLKDRKGCIDLSDRLVAFARSHGVDRNRGVMINEVGLDGALHNANARLWPQTERLKAALARFRRTGETDEANEAVQAFAGLQVFLKTPVSGLWRDKLQADGQWVCEPAPGSSLYHITCSLAELIDG